MSELARRAEQGSRTARMRAAVIAGPRRAELAEVERPTPGPGQVRVRVEGCGVCGSNGPAWEGREWFNYPLAPGAPGHEGWGVVDEVGDGVSEVKQGDRVAFLSGNAFAEYDIAAGAQVVRLPSSLDSMPFPGEAIGCAFNIFRRSDIRAGQTVSIVGIGFLGALVTRLAKNAGARVIAITRRKFALDIAKQYGADELVPMIDHWKIVETVKSLTGGRMCERSIEAVGTQWPLDLASELTAERGRLIIAGYHQDGLRQVNMQSWNWRGLDVINAHERDPKVYVEGIRLAVDAVASGSLDPSRLLTHRFALEDLGDALDALERRPDGFMKAWVAP